MISNQRGVMRSNKIINTNNKKYKSLHLKNSNTKQQKKDNFVGHSLLKKKLLFLQQIVLKFKSPIR